MPQIPRITEGTRRAQQQSGTPARPGPQVHDHQARQDEQGGQLGLRPDRRDEHDAEDAPEDGVTLVGAARQAVGRHRDDGDDDGPDAVKEGLHPGEAPEGHVQPGQGEHHEEGRHDEGETDQRGAQHAPLEVADGDRRLRRQGTRHNLGEGDGEVIGPLVDALAVVDQVLAHIPHERRRPAETDGAELQEVQDQLPQAQGWGWMSRCAVPWLTVLSMQ